MGEFRILLPLLVVFATSISLCRGQDVIALAQAINKLGIDLHRVIATKGDGNLFLSPLGISTALEMLNYGSREKNAEELRRGLGYQDVRLTDSQVQEAFKGLMKTMRGDLSANEYIPYLVNAAFIRKDYPVLPEYKNGLLKNYKATAYDVDFKEGDKTVEEVNDWVKLKTNSNIETSLDDVNTHDVLILVNHLSTQELWENPFNPKDTTEEVFYNKGLQSEQIKVQMMHLVAELPYVRFADGQFIEIPYKNENISMLLLLPDAMEGAYELEHKFEPTNARKALQEAGKVKVRLSLPKFKLQYQKTLNAGLEELGIQNVFKNKADLSGISKAGSIVVSEVVHKVSLQINEEGSGGSGDSGVVAETTMVDGGHEVLVNHPFLWSIVDKRNGVVYFQCRLSQL